MLKCIRCKDNVVDQNNGDWRSWPWPFGPKAQGLAHIASMPYYIYVLKSLKDGKNYIGHTQNTTKRLLQHNKGVVKSTQYRKPFKIIYTEIFNTELDAVNREKYLKTHKGYNDLRKILLINSGIGAVG